MRVENTNFSDVIYEQSPDKGGVKYLVRRTQNEFRLPKPPFKRFTNKMNDVGICNRAGAQLAWVL